MFPLKLLLNSLTMKEGKRKLYAHVIDPESNIDEIYEPLTPQYHEQFAKETHKTSTEKCFVNLFSRSQVELNVLKPILSNQL